MDDPLDTRVCTCGLPLAGTEVRISGESEILVRGISVCDGYHADEEKNAQAFDADGWLHTGDRGALDADGRVRFLGRLKEMMKVGGENVAEVEVESHISTHPAVKLVQVVGVPGRAAGRGPGGLRRAATGVRGHARRTSSPTAAGRSRASRSRATCAS